MDTGEDGEERPLAWTAILEDTPAFSSDGENIGVVREVIGSEAEDVFHGLVVSPGAVGHDVLIPAEHVGAITNRRIMTRLNADQIKSLAPYRAEASYHLGFVGLIRRRLGWVEEGRDEE